jgi:hypothetical protein
MIHDLRRRMVIRFFSNDGSRFRVRIARRRCGMTALFRTLLPTSFLLRKRSLQLAPLQLRPQNEGRKQQQDRGNADPHPHPSPLSIGLSRCFVPQQRSGRAWAGTRDGNRFPHGARRPLNNRRRHGSAASGG